MTRRILLILLALTLICPYRTQNCDLSTTTPPMDNLPESTQKVAQNANESLTSLYVTATAYCPCEKCCGKCTGITATGEKAVQGATIAADWDVFPPYTRLDIEGMGRRIVHDKGGAINGKHIDIYFDSHEEALAFGKQILKVTILED